MNRLQAIIFDMDGTLADTEEIHRQAFNIAFAEFHLPLNWSIPEYRRLLSISGGRERIRHCLKQQGVVDHQEAELHTLTDTVHARKSEIYRDKLRRGEVQIRPGIRRLIQEARAAGLKLAIATASSAHNVETLLAATLGADASGLFSTIISSDQVEEKKPSPAAYQVCLTELKLQPQHCIAIEDTRNGNLAALQAGLTTVITTHHLTIDNDFSGAALVLNHLGEPDFPFTATTGQDFGATSVDLALLEKILRG
ncbi:MAG: HAD-IA family hydrolase [Gammaproteobacteria bacterium]